MQGKILLYLIFLLGGDRAEGKGVCGRLMSPIQETQSMREIRLLRGRLPCKGGGLTYEQKYFILARGILCKCRTIHNQYLSGGMVCIPLILAKYPTLSHRILTAGHSSFFLQQLQVDFYKAKLSFRYILQIKNQPKIVHHNNFLIKL